MGFMERQVVLVLGAEARPPALNPGSVFWFPARMAVIANDVPTVKPRHEVGWPPNGRLSIAPLARAGDPVINT